MERLKKCDTDIEIGSEEYHHIKSEILQEKDKCSNPNDFDELLSVFPTVIQAAENRHKYDFALVLRAEHCDTLYCSSGHAKKSGQQQLHTKAEQLDKADEYAEDTRKRYEEWRKKELLKFPVHTAVWVYGYSAMIKLSLAEFGKAETFLHIAQTHFKTLCPSEPAQIEGHFSYDTTDDLISQALTHNCLLEAAFLYNCWGRYHRDNQIRDKRATEAEPEKAITYLKLSQGIYEILAHKYHLYAFSINTIVFIVRTYLANQKRNWRDVVDAATLRDASIELNLAKQWNAYLKGTRSDDNQQSCRTDFLIAFYQSFIYFKRALLEDPSQKHYQSLLRGAEVGIRKIQLKFDKFFTESYELEGFLTLITQLQANAAAQALTGDGGVITATGKGADSKMKFRKRSAHHRIHPQHWQAEYQGFTTDSGFATTDKGSDAEVIVRKNMIAQHEKKDINLKEEMEVTNSESANVSGAMNTTGPVCVSQYHKGGYGSTNTVSDSDSPSIYENGSHNQIHSEYNESGSTNEGTQASYNMMPDRIKYTRAGKDQEDPAGMAYSLPPLLAMQDQTQEAIMAAINQGIQKALGQVLMGIEDKAARINTAAETALASVTKVTEAALVKVDSVTTAADNALVKVDSVTTSADNALVKVDRMTIVAEAALARVTTAANTAYNTTRESQATRMTATSETTNQITEDGTPNMMTKVDVEVSTSTRTAGMTTAGMTTLSSGGLTSTSNSDNGIEFPTGAVYAVATQRVRTLSVQEPSASPRKHMVRKHSVQERYQPRPESMGGLSTDTEDAGRNDPSNTKGRVRKTAEHRRNSANHQSYALSQNLGNTDSAETEILPSTNMENPTTHKAGSGTSRDNSSDEENNRDGNTSSRIADGVDTNSESPPSDFDSSTSVISSDTHHEPEQQSES